MRKDLQTATPVNCPPSDAVKPNNTNCQKKTTIREGNVATKATASAPSKLGIVLLQRQFKQLSSDPPEGISVWLEVKTP